LNFSLSYPLKRHAFQRVGMTYRIDKSNITAFSTASQTFFQTISFRSGIQGSNALAGIVSSSASFSYIYNTINNPLRSRTARNTPRFPGCRYWRQRPLYLAAVAYKRFLPMHYLTPNAMAAMFSESAPSSGMCRALAATSRPPTTASILAAKAI